MIEWGADWLHFRKLAALTAVSSLEIINNPTLVDALRCSLLHQEMPGWKAAITSFTKSGGYAGLTYQSQEVPFYRTSNAMFSERSRNRSASGQGCQFPMEGFPPILKSGKGTFTINERSDVLVKGELLLFKMESGG